MNYRWLPFFLFVIVVVLSGCTNQSFYTSSISSNVAGIVKLFEFQPKEIYDVDRAYLKMRLENDYPFLIKNIYVDIYGLGNDWGLIDVQGTKINKLKDTSSLDIDANFRINKEYQIADSNVIINGDVYVENIENIFKGELPDISVEGLDVFIMRKDVSIMIEDIDKLLGISHKNNYEKVADVAVSDIYKSAAKTPPVYIDYLAPPIPSQNFPGEIVDLWWVVKPPSDLPYGTTLTKEVKARVCYEVVETIPLKVRFINFGEALREKTTSTTKKETLSSFVETTVIYQDPLIMYEDEESPVVFTVEMINHDKGVVTQESCKEVITGRRESMKEEINKIKFELEGFNCEINKDNIYIPSQGKISFVVYCTVQTPNMPKYEDYLDLKISYTYYVDVSTSIKVKGTRRD